MPGSVAVAPPVGSRTFAGVLASFTGAAKRAEDSWDDSVLADDVAIISYEQAVRSHRRVRVPGPAPESATETHSELPVRAADSAGSRHIKERKTASITIRLTAAEAAQLHERAAEAKLSVSAYLRSCIFETESLRAQVKEALSRMRATSSDTMQAADEAEAVPYRRFRFFPRWTRKSKA